MNEKISRLCEIKRLLCEVVKTEEEKQLNRNTKEKAKSEGISTSAQYGISLIENCEKNKVKSLKESLTSALDSKISSEIYNLLREEEKYSVCKKHRHELKIAFHESSVNTLQLIKKNVNCVL